MAAIIAGAIGAVLGLIVFHAGVRFAEALRDWLTAREAEKRRKNGERHG
jgi:hypothetical protein